MQLESKDLQHELWFLHSFTLALDLTCSPDPSTGFLNFIPVNYPAIPPSLQSYPHDHAVQMGISMELIKQQ